MTVDEGRGTSDSSGNERPVVVITGAAGGIGSAVADRFLVGGWRLAALDISPIMTRHDQLEIAVDLRDVSAIARAIARAASWGGRIDAVVNAAGVWTEGPSADTTEAEWDRVLGVNLKGLYFTTIAAIPHLAQTEGCIINLSSDAGIQGNSGAAVYCASKGGVSILTKSLALELAPRGIRVNAVCPGDVDSPMLHGQAAAFGGDQPQAYLDRLLANYPQGKRARFVSPNEIAELIWFLAQPAAAPITGTNISVDFGLSAGIT
ncbi:MAG: SDR family oxidoreductase [Actinobacteria bacterium]|nr:SDR family oxidoreductase [Actinomycetota bacterium]